MIRSTHTLTLIDTPLAIVRLAPDAPVPAWAHAPPFASITRTPAELSIVCPDRAVPADVVASRGWRAFRVDGPLDLSLVGVLVAIAEPLAAAGVNVFPIATYDTDWILVPDARVAEARRALEGAGHHVH